MAKRKLEHHGITVGRVQPPEYQVWAQMKQRCFNKKHPKYKDYGGRGITMDPRWKKSFTAFLAEVGPRPADNLSIERIDNEQGYFPENVKWADSFIQNKNKRNMK